MRKHNVHDSEQEEKRGKKSKQTLSYILRDKRKSVIEEQSERPQHQDQSKRVRLHNSHN